MLVLLIAMLLAGNGHIFLMSLFLVLFIMFAALTFRFPDLKDCNIPQYLLTKVIFIMLAPLGFI